MTLSNNTMKGVSAIMGQQMKLAEKTWEQMSPDP